MLLGVDWGGTKIEAMSMAEDAKGASSTWLNGRPVAADLRRKLGHEIRVAMMLTASQSRKPSTAPAPRLRPEQVVPVLDRLLRASGMFFRSGSRALGICDVAGGRLIGIVEAHINSWDCLGGIGVCRSAGVRVSDYLSGHSPPHGGPIVVGTPEVFDQLVSVLGVPV